MGTTSGHTRGEDSTKNKGISIDADFPRFFPFFHFQAFLHRVVLEVATLVDVSRRANVQDFFAPLERGKVNGLRTCHIPLIGQTRTVGEKGESMIQSQQVAYDPYAYPDPAPCPYCMPYYVAPYPSLTVSYDPYWPSRVAPTTRPLTPVSPAYTPRFRGEFRVGNCLLIYE